MPKTFIDGVEVKRWLVNGARVKKAYYDGRLVFQEAGEYALHITENNHAVGSDWLWTLLPIPVRNDPSQTVRIVVHAGIQLVTSDTAINGVLDCTEAWGGREVILENYGYMLGRGGNGGSTYGSNSYPGAVGGRAIRNTNCLLRVFNHGVIGGGGGGGAGTAAKRSGSSSQCSWGGGGGAPFGAGGIGTSGVYVANGGPAGFDTPGYGVKDPSANAGNGGAWGVKGEDSSRSTHTGSYWPTVGGQPGVATSGSIIWEVLGDVRGARV